MVYVLFRQDAVFFSFPVRANFETTRYWCIIHNLDTTHSHFVWSFTRLHAFAFPFLLFLLIASLASSCPSEISLTEHSAHWQRHGIYGCEAIASYSYIIIHFYSLIPCFLPHPNRYNTYVDSCFTIRNENKQQMKCPRRESCLYCAWLL
jgi:hypothetical protein